MINKNEQVEIFDEEETLTLAADDGNEYTFVQVACVEKDGEFFALLEPADEKQAEEEGLYVFKILNYDDPDADWEVEPVEDEEHANEGYDMFFEVYSAECDGDCAACEAECDEKK